MGRGLMMRGMIRGGMQRTQMNPRAPMRGPVQRQMTVPKPITPKKPVPRPMLMSPQEWAKTPSPANSPGTPPNAGRGVSPRGRSPVTPPQAGWAGELVLGVAIPEFSGYKSRNERSHVPFGFYRSSFAIWRETAPLQNPAYSQNSAICNIPLFPEHEFE